MAYELLIARIEAGFLPPLFALVLISYLLGSIPFGCLVANLVGVDIRAAGSGNIGATNVVRVLGKRYGYPVFLLDFLKGLLAVKLSILITAHSEIGLSRESAGILGGILCVVGHSYSVWLGFRGGKGVATSGGVVSGLMPLVALIAGITWVAVFQITRYVSVASVAAVVSIPLVCAILLGAGYLHGVVLFYFSLAIAVVVILRHRTNLSRLVRGREPRFERK